jgi:hypothetical protein
MQSNLSDSVTITIRYDKYLQKITSVLSEPAVINKGMPFVMFLFTIFKSYPEIEKKYPAGTLGLMVNGKPPQDYDILQDGDIVFITSFFKN